MVLKYVRQELPEKLKVYTDTDFAGCRRTRRSTSGGVVMLGSHCLKTYSSTQEIVALSSGEAEFYGDVKAASHGIGVQGILRGMGIMVKLEVLTDSSAAKSIASRRGVGKVRHIEVREMWVQERVARGDLEIRKIRGEDNIADVLTKRVPRSVLDKHLWSAGFVRRRGRHHLNPILESR